MLEWHEAGWRFAQRPGAAHVTTARRHSGEQAFHPLAGSIQPRESGRTEHRSGTRAGELGSRLAS